MAKNYYHEKHGDEHFKLFVNQVEDEEIPPEQIAIVRYEEYADHIVELLNREPYRGGLVKSVSASIQADAGAKGNG